MFRRGVCRTAFDSDDACTQGDVHDSAASVFEHERDFVLHTTEDAAEVDIDDPFLFLQLVIGCRSGFAQLNACVIEREI